VVAELEGAETVPTYLKLGLRTASTKGYDEVVKLLLDHKADVNVEGEWERLPRGDIFH
jgi:hypothetical protein